MIKQVGSSKHHILSVSMIPGPAATVWPVRPWPYRFFLGGAYPQTTLMHTQWPYQSEIAGTGPGMGLTQALYPNQFLPDAMAITSGLHCALTDSNVVLISSSKPSVVSTSMQVCAIALAAVSVAL